VSANTETDRVAYGAPARAYFPLAPDLIYLNHGGFGLTPHCVLAEQAAWRERIERNPSGFMARELPQMLRDAAAALASYLKVRPDNLVFVDNATTGCNAVLRSLELEHDDEILTTNYAYAAIAKAIGFAARRGPAKVVTAELPMPLRDASEAIEALASRLSARTRLVVLDHIASRSACILPVAAMAQLAHQAGARVLVDGAHAPGQIELDLPASGADWYVGNCHKWLFAPRPCGFLWANPQVDEVIHPTTISHGYGAGFTAEFDWTGTRDPSPALSVPAALAAHARLGGAHLMARNAALARRAGEMLAQAWGTETAAPSATCAAMATIRMALKPPSGLAIGAVRSRPTVELELRAHLARKHRIEAEIFAQAGALWLRIAAQAYNEWSEYERLATAVQAL